MRLLSKVMSLLVVLFALTASVCYAGGNTQDLYQSLLTNTDGNPKGKITLVEFYDFRCGTCQRMAPVLKQVMRDQPQLRVVYREYPILGGSSEYAAQAAIAAKMQNRYLALRSLLINSSAPLTEKSILNLATKAQLDPTVLQKDMKSSYVKNQLKQTDELAQAWDIPGTPTIFIGKPNEKPTMLVGYYSAQELNKIIQQKLQ